MLWPSCRCSPWCGCVTRWHFPLRLAFPGSAGGTRRPRMEPGVPASAPVGTETPTEEARLCRLGREVVPSPRICVPKQSRTEPLLKECCAGLRVRLRFCLKKRYNGLFWVTLPNSAEEQDKRNKGFYCCCFFPIFSCCWLCTCDSSLMVSVLLFTQLQSILSNDLWARQ